MARQRICIINVVGLTPRLMDFAPNCRSVGNAKPWRPVLPAVTSTVQATWLTGKLPSQHGIVANGWYYRETAEIRFWQQHCGLVQGEKFYEGYQTAKMFWWFNQNAPVRWSVTPKPHYGCDGSKVFDVLDRSECQLTSKLGPFPFFAFWGPAAGLASSRWIADASALVMRAKQPEITLVYLPHLDYDFQRFEEHASQRVREVDDCVGTLLQACQEIQAIPIIVSEYGLTPVSRAVFLNRELRKAGFLAVRNGPFGEMLLPGESRAFAVCDHQVAHVYVNQKHDIDAVRRCLESIDGVGKVCLPHEANLDHPRSGELIVMAKPDTWFAYYYWDDDQAAPDFARTVDIHRKPGYDPCELFMTSKLRAAGRLLQKKIGARYKMDVIPLDTSLVKGSHGLWTDPQDGPLIIGPDAPDEMVDFFSYARGLLN